MNQLALDIKTDYQPTNDWRPPTRIPRVPPNTIVALDTECWNEDLLHKGAQFITGKDFPVGFSLAFDGWRGYFPVAHREGNVEFDAVGMLRELLSRKDIVMVAANTRYDLEALWKWWIHPQCTISDVQVMEALLDENQESYSLDAIGKRRKIGSKDKQAMEAWMVAHGFVKKGKVDYGRMDEMPPWIVGPYAEQDAELTLAIYKDQLKQIYSEELSTVAALENDLIPILFMMRARGVSVDIEAAQRLNEEMEAQLAIDRQQFPADFDPWSSESLSRWIATQFGLAVPKTEKGKDSIQNQWLEDTGVPDLVALADWRKLDKIRRDFVVGLVLEGNHHGLLHPQWFSTRGSGHMAEADINGTRQGRIGCVDPNLTTLPRRHKIWGPATRRLFIPFPEERWCKADFASQEPRIGLHYANLLRLPGVDRVMEMYRNDPKTSFHKVVVAMVNAARAEPIEYDKGKTINLALSYGMGKKKLARSLKMSEAAVESILATYDGQVPFVRALLKQASQIAMARGFVRTVLGRKRRFNQFENAEFGATWEKPLPYDEAIKKWSRVRRSGTFKASNAIGQGSAAEQTKMAIVKLWRNHSMLPLMQVYDELSYSIDNLDQARTIKYEMEHAIEFTVPSVAEVQIGPNWADKQEIVE